MYYHGDKGMNRGIKIVDNPYLSALFPLFVRGDTKTEDFIPLLVRRDLSRNISVWLTQKKCCFQGLA